MVVRDGRPRAMYIPKIRNLVGARGGISGQHLLEKLNLQVSDLKTKFLSGKAKIKKVNQRFEVIVNRKKFFAKKVILATGVEDIHPPIKNFFELAVKNVLGYCPICDGFEYCDQPIAVFVGDSHGLKKIPFIAHYSPNLHIVLVKDFKIPHVYQKQLDHLKLKVYRGKLEKLRIGKKKKTLEIFLKNQKPFTVRLGYVSLGVKIRDSAFKKMVHLRRTKEGYIITKTHQETSIKGLYAVGDCVNALSQVSVAVGHAATAATAIHNELPNGTKMRLRHGDTVDE